MLKARPAVSFALLLSVTTISAVGFSQTVAPVQPPQVPPAATAPAYAPAPAPTTQPPAGTPGYAPAPAPIVPGQPVPQNYTLVPVATQFGYYYPEGAPLPPSAEIPYDGSSPVPEGYRVEYRSRRGLVIAGSIVGGIAYGLSLGVAISDNFSDKTALLAIPVLGPWLNLAMSKGQKNCSALSNSTYSYSYSSEYDSCQSDNDALKIVWVTDGLMQLAGATMLTLGLALPTSKLVYRGVSMSVTPSRVGRDGYGLGAVGQF